ncbi:GntR family transcriptional regulator [Micrococcoides hystricis]|uniref:GntR family transcriptional regulator n=1 Tax=Micrococcoides hystricis TaxID=1572761 RepID=A0ABV6P6X9_9MICC
MTGKARSARTEAYEALRAKILTLELRPGQRLSDVQLAHDLAMSRTPIREALFSLSHENLIVLTERGGFSVKNLDLDETQAAFEALHLISRAVARKMALQADPEKIATLRDYAQQVEVAMIAADPAQVAQANADFHIAEAQLAGNQFFADTIRTLQTLLQRLAFVSFGGSDGPSHSLADHYALAHEHHEELLQFYLAGEVESAEKLAAQHVELFQRRVEDYFARNDTKLMSI